MNNEQTDTLVLNTILTKMDTILSKFESRLTALETKAVEPVATKPSDVKASPSGRTSPIGNKVDDGMIVSINESDQPNFFRIGVRLAKMDKTIYGKVWKGAVFRGTYKTEHQKALVQVGQPILGVYEWFYDNKTKSMTDEPIFKVHLSHSPTYKLAFYSEAL